MSALDQEIEELDAKRIRLAQMRDHPAIEPDTREDVAERIKYLDERIQRLKSQQPRPPNPQRSGRRDRFERELRNRFGGRGLIWK